MLKRCSKGLQIYLYSIQWCLSFFIVPLSGQREQYFANKLLTFIQESILIMSRCQMKMFQDVKMCKLCVIVHKRLYYLPEVVDLAVNQ